MIDYLIKPLTYLLMLIRILSKMEFAMIIFCINKINTLINFVLKFKHINQFGLKSNKN